MKIYEYFYGFLRVCYRKVIGFRRGDYQDYRYVEFFDQEANDLVDNMLSDAKPCLITKFGTIELDYLVNYEMVSRKHHSIVDIFNYIRGFYPSLWSLKPLDWLCSNAGFFPNDTTLLKDFYLEYMKVLPQIDILGSYIYEEKVFDEKINNAKRVNLHGYYYPFFYKNPWTRRLKGKKVLVISPFDKEIEQQYRNREKLFADTDVLPEFTLITYKAVQSMLGIKTDYETWFDALQKMKNDIANIDFDIALIGCGAYGMPLAAHVKMKGKQAVHLAGNTQLLFGIIGKRWQDMPQTAKFMNEYWIHPSNNSIPKNHSRIEGGHIGKSS